MEEISPFIETAKESRGGSIKLNYLDMSFVVNVVVIIMVLYLVYALVRGYNSKEDESDDEDGEQSYIEEQVDLLKTRQQKYLN